MTFTNWLRTYGTFVEQPRIIRTVGQYAAGVCGAGGIAALTANDYFRAQPDEQKKVLVRDGLVLGGTAVGTFLAARHFMPLPTNEEAKLAVGHFVDDVKKVLTEAEDSGAYSKLVEHLDSLNGKVRLKVSDYKKIINDVQKNAKNEEAAKKVLQDIFEDKEDFPGWNKALWKKLTQHGSITKDEVVEEGEVRKMMNFFVVGGLSVLSGIAGGLVANKVNGNKDPDSMVNMVKEGVFQFVANIALCAVGAFGAILGMSHKPIAEKLASMGAAGKALKTVGICAGLSLGIFGGGVIANKLGSKVINPLCDKIQGKEPQPETDPNQGKRKIEFWDAILHLDDVPTALALAGLEIVEPIIPYFFGISGYRAGIGYRNDDAAKAGKGKPAPIAFSQSEQGKLDAAPESMPQSPMLVNPMQVQLKAQNSPFSTAMQSPWQLPQQTQPQSFTLLPQGAPAA